MTRNYDELAARAERGELTPIPNTAVAGTPEAHAEIQQLLMDATGTTTLDDAIRFGVGRPPAGTKRGPSPVIRARVPQTVKDRLTHLATTQHRDESDIIREAVTAYLERASA